MTNDDEVQRKLERMWSDPAERGAVLAELRRYGQEPYERENGRVWLAILKLCGGRSEEVAELVAAAKRDYRDVLMWAEYPGEGQALWALRPNLTADEQRRLDELRKEDRRQYLEWLEK